MCNKVHVQNCSFCCKLQPITRQTRGRSDKVEIPSELRRWVRSADVVGAERGRKSDKHKVAVIEPRVNVSREYYLRAGFSAVCISGCSFYILSIGCVLSCQFYNKIELNWIGHCRTQVTFKSSFTYTCLPSKLPPLHHQSYLSTCHIFLPSRQTDGTTANKESILPVLSSPMCSVW